MGKDEYATAGGGALKLKGVKNAGVEKKRRKDKRPKSKPAEKALATPVAEEEEPVRGDEELDTTSKADTELREPLKTEAERRHEEMRRKRVREAEEVDGADVNC